jgi:hypothetical protein
VLSLRDPAFHTVIVPRNGSPLAETSLHEVLLIQTASGQQWFIDPTGAQYGIREPLAPCHQYNYVQEGGKITVTHFSGDIQGYLDKLDDKNRLVDVMEAMQFFEIRQTLSTFLDHHIVTIETTTGGGNFNDKFLKVSAQDFAKNLAALEEGVKTCLAECVKGMYAPSRKRQREIEFKLRAAKLMGLKEDALRPITRNTSTITDEPLDNYVTHVLRTRYVQR